MDFSRFRALYMFFTASAQQPDATFATYLTNTMTCHSDLLRDWVLSPHRAFQHEQYAKHASYYTPTP